MVSAGFPNADLIFADSFFLLTVAGFLLIFADPAMSVPTLIASACS